MSATVFVTGFGDNRTFDGNAPYGASRLQMYIDFDNLTGIVYLSASTAYVPLPTTVSPSGFTTHTAAPYPHQPKALTLTRLSNDQVKVHVEAFNGFCRYIDIDSCPAIDADMVFNRQSNGEWTTSASAVDRDNYPSLAV